MHVGKESEDPTVQHQHKATAVEACNCPRGYSGSSCEVITKFKIY